MKLGEYMEPQKFVRLAAVAWARSGLDPYRDSLYRSYLEVYPELAKAFISAGERRGYDSRELISALHNSRYFSLMSNPTRGGIGEYLKEIIPTDLSTKEIADKAYELTCQKAGINSPLKPEDTDKFFNAWLEIYELNREVLSNMPETPEASDEFLKRLS